MSDDIDDTQKSKKRDASSPLQEPCYNLKKSKQTLGSVSETDTADSNSDSNSDSDSNLSFDLAPEAETDMASSTSPKSVLPDSDIDRIACRVKDMMTPLVKGMIDSSLNEFKQLYDQKFQSQDQEIQQLHNENDKLRSELVSLKGEVAKLKSRDDEHEQYSRRNSIRIMGVKESDARPTDDIVLDIAQQHSIDVDVADIDRSHRVGRKADDKDRAVLVKFTSYRAKRAFMSKKKELGTNLFFNDDLTRIRGEVLYQARKCRKAKRLKGAWSFDGRIFIKCLDDSTQEVNSLLDIEAVIREAENKRSGGQPMFT